jgi:mannose-1-phosphate guanylyltransferase/mannose-6-phosphate isomerase
MSMPAITPVVLCGGSGTRLWPLSRKSFPKQFVPLVGNRSLLQLTLERLSVIAPRMMTVAADEHRFMVIESLDAAGVSGPVLLEPIGRNTAAAMALAALTVSQTADPSTMLLFCPADHHIPDAKAFAATVAQGVPAAQAGSIVTFGVTPSFPSTAYGYIRQGESRPDGTRKVATFIEKPDADRAAQLLLQGDVLWNAGIFLARADVLLQAIERHAQDILSDVKKALVHGREEVIANNRADHPINFIRPQSEMFSAVRSQSIDFAVMERHDNIAVVPFAGQWSDVGSWNAVADLSPADAQSNRLQGHAVAHGSHNTFVHAPHRPVVALGTRDLLIIDTPDAVLVAHRDNAEQVKDVVARLERERCTQAISHRKVSRPWGWYDSVDQGERFQVKRIGVKPGASLSLQKHHHRAEHWIVVKGTAEVTRGGDTFLLSENESTYIPVGEVHRLRNPGRIELEMIEVQSGSYLGEDDIVRLEDTYGRAPAGGDATPR